MNENNCIIRLETPADYAEVEKLVRDAFWNVYRAGCLEHYVLHCMRSDTDFVPELDLVMEIDGKIIGQVVFMRAHIKSDDGANIPIMTMGPICIESSMRRKGYGKLLLDCAIEKAKKTDAGALCFEGDIAFYGKSGFVCASEYGIRYHGIPEGEDASFFLCKELTEGYLENVTGEYTPPSVYFVDEKKAEEFDAAFPYKEKSEPSDRPQP